MSNNRDGKDIHLILETGVRSKNTGMYILK